MRSLAMTPSATGVPGSKVARAITTLSSGCRRMTDGGAMVVSLRSEQRRSLGSHAWRSACQSTWALPPMKCDMHLACCYVQVGTVALAHHLAGSALCRPARWQTMRHAAKKGFYMQGLSEG